MKVQSTHEVVVKRGKEVKRLRAEGLTLTEVATKMGLPLGTVSYYVYKPETAEQPKHPVRPPKRQRIMSVVGATATNGVVHHDWYVAGMLRQYASHFNLDVKGLLSDVESIFNEENN